MSVGCSLQFYCESIFIKNSSSTYKFQHLKARERFRLQRLVSSRAVLQDHWCFHVSTSTYRPLHGAPCHYRPLKRRSFAIQGSRNEIPILKATTSLLTRSYSTFCRYPLLLQLVPAVGCIAFTVWGLEPLVRYCRSFFLHRNDSSWKKSRTRYFLTSYLQPLMLWTGAIIVCRALDPIVLTTEASQAVKQRLLNFTRSLSTVLAFAYCLSSLIHQAQKFFLETNEVNDARKMGIQFAGRAIYTAVWVAAISLFIELLGFSTQRWLTAGGLGTVLLTLAGREIFTNFLSSVMIHATRPFILNEWIQTRIEGYEVSGTVEHVGWWSPTVIRGDDREAVHIPNHKFTVTVVRNLSQKTHWRVKTHFAISHLDANKISNIVADMRKVLAKNPQVEQQRLHRRVFFDYIDPENQAFMILISCFVKTSRFEEYLCVKEGILLDLLRVITHHRARLATPIRTVRKMYGDMDLENIPFAETIVTRGARTPMSRPLYLIEPGTRINGDDKAKSRSMPQTNEDQSLKSSMSSDQKATNPVSDDSNFQGMQQKVSPTGDSSLVSDGTVQDDSADKVQPKKSKSPPSAESSVSSTSEVLNTKRLNNKDSAVNHDKIQTNLSDSATLRKDGTQVPAAHVKQETEKPSSPAPPVTRSPLEDNIVLGMALEGSKRTLPIEEGMSSPSEAKELAGQRNGSGLTSSAKEKQDGLTKSQAAPGGPSNDQRDSDT